MAVSIKKIRVGNVVSVGGNMTVVESIDATGINGDDGYSAADIDHLKCVPEMLIQFGFQKLKENSIIIGQGKTLYHHSCGMFLEPQPDDSFRLSSYPNCPITTITQVQNILLDLFNFDLIIQL